ncbi:MAG: undecaprenyl-diphosphate phosphatase [Thermoplasmatota archaeon]
MSLTYWEAILLGLIQGLTEWLPVSSSGHLQIGRAVLGLEADTWYDLLLHVGTLVVIVVVFWRRILQLVGAAFGPRSPEKRFAWGLVMGSVPIAVTGFLLADVVERAFEHLTAVGAALIFTAYFLHSTRDLDGSPNLTPNRAWSIGLWQVLALLPGVSRSGATIAGGLHAGLDRETAADFGFLLAIPALVGATLFKATDAAGAAVTGPMIVGILVSLATGYATLRWLRGFVGRRGVHAFAPYCLVLGLAVLLMTFFS